MHGWINGVNIHTDTFGEDFEATRGMNTDVAITRADVPPVD